MSALKFDKGKEPLDLIPNVSLLAIAEIMEHGAAKYSRHNWRKGMNWSRLISAAMRHLSAWNNGVDKDEESGLSHLAHAATCLVFLLEYEQTQRNYDDRYKGEPYTYYETDLQTQEDE